jgi:hypothetical protein
VKESEVRKYFLFSENKKLEKNFERLRRVKERGKKR